MSEVVKRINKLFETGGLLPKHYVDLARIKAARVQRAKDFPLTKAEQAVVRQIEGVIEKKKKQEKFLPQEWVKPEELVEEVKKPAPKKRRSKKVNDAK